MHLKLSLAKADFAVGLKIDADDFDQCMKAARSANYQGRFTLIFVSEGDEWTGLDVERKFIQAQVN